MPPLRRRVKPEEADHQDAVVAAFDPGFASPVGDL
jgi:hypothetical protein